MKQKQELRSFFSRDVGQVRRRVQQRRGKFGSQQAIQNQAFAKPVRRISLMLVSWSQPLHVLSLMLLPLWNYMTTCLIYRSRSRSHSAGQTMLQASPSIQLNLLSLCHLHHEIFHVSLQALKNHLYHYSTGPSVIIFCNGILLDIMVIITPTISCQHGSTSINVHITCLHHHAVVHLQ